MPRIRTKPPRTQKTLDMRVPCTKCDRVWSGSASIKTLAGKLLREGWSRDLEDAVGWLCPECSDDLLPGDD